MPTGQLSDNWEFARTELARKTVECWKKFEQDKFKDQICFWEKSPAKLSIPIKEGDYRASLAREEEGNGDLGAKLAGKKFGYLTRYSWKLGALKAGDPDFTICGNTDWGKNVIFLTRDPADCK